MTNLKKNDRIELISMPDDPNPIPSGTRGTVKDVQYVPYFNFYQVTVEWDNGSSLMLSMPPDLVRVLNSEEDDD